MSEETKNIIDVLLAVIGTIGAVVAFIHTLRTWREGQHWRRAEQLDKFIERFEADEMLKLSCLILRAERGINPIPTFRFGYRDRLWPSNEKVADGMNIPPGKSNQVRTSITRR